eukprot:TRINITY_DN31991_c0_g1_i1.p1 TRINITY_DN31991_c0_g1~~TRINITY_DN31991_c0_g1_i1.p1  ORF type:complete len:141 (-),score=3.80 TRINITY_DN31991_c0_g1_i1:211-633(-)
MQSNGTKYRLIISSDASHQTIDFRATDFGVRHFGRVRYAEYPDELYSTLGQHYSEHHTLKQTTGWSFINKLLHGVTLAVVDSNSAVSFSVEQLHKIGKNIVVAHTVIPLADLPKSELVEVVIPPTEKGHSTVGRCRYMCV